MALYVALYITCGTVQALYIMMLELQTECMQATNCLNFHKYYTPVCLSCFAAAGVGLSAGKSHTNAMTKVAQVVDEARCEWCCPASHSFVCGKQGEETGTTVLLSKHQLSIQLSAGRPSARIACQRALLVCADDLEVTSSNPAVAPKHKQ